MNTCVPVIVFEVFEFAMAALAVDGDFEEGDTSVKHVQSRIVVENKKNKGTERRTKQEEI